MIVIDADDDDIKPHLDRDTNHSSDCNVKPEVKNDANQRLPEHSSARLENKPNDKLMSTIGTVIVFNHTNDNNSSNGIHLDLHCLSGLSTIPHICRFQIHSWGNHRGDIWKGSMTMKLGSTLRVTQLYFPTRMIQYTRDHSGIVRSLEIKRTFTTYIRCKTLSNFGRTLGMTSTTFKVL